MIEAMKAVLWLTKCVYFILTQEKFLLISLDMGCSVYSHNGIC